MCVNRRRPPLLCLLLLLTGTLTVLRAPTSAAHSHWVSELSPPQWQRFLSYMTGWLVYVPPRAQSECVTLADDLCLALGILRMAKCHGCILLRHRGHDSGAHCSQQPELLAPSLARDATDRRDCGLGLNDQDSVLTSSLAHGRGLCRSSRVRLRAAGPIALGMFDLRFVVAMEGASG